jgi:putative PIN family toxin of toxin-antitoxin system
MSEPPGVVFDCNLIVQALLNPRGKAAACRRRVLAGEAQLFISQPVVAEITEVLQRPSVRKFVPSLSIEQIDAFWKETAAKAVMLYNVPEEFHYPRDPDDEAYVNLAIVARATYLVSRDNDPLDLMRKQSPEAQGFRTR